MKHGLIGLKLHIKGIVQGVGFRPFVYRLAVEKQLTGWINNTSAGVEIEINGSEEQISSFLQEFSRNLPPLAQVDTIEKESVSPKDYSSFQIVESQNIAGEFFPIPADSAICPDCMRELFDPHDRRFRYPFINCTNCGPRYSIIRSIPYDRPNTTMADFILCTDCQKEYDNPLDRRFHAQPVACPVCGPNLWSSTNGTAHKEDKAIQVIRDLIANGKIAAIKGLGGFHLACDALNENAINNLRVRKHRFDKPFAVMVFDETIAKTFFEISSLESTELNSRVRPIVLLKPRSKHLLPKALTQGLDRIGVMLPYTPMHYLLLEPAPDMPPMWVMTSGNLSEEPIAITDESAMQKLSEVADAFLFHNREIHARIDDSVVFSAHNNIHIMRRSRGYAPNAVRLPFQADGIFAAGALLKNTFSIGRGEYSFMSPHIGDLENSETYNSYKLAFDQYQKLFSLSVKSVAVDLHPDYLSTRFAHQYAIEHNLQIIPIQHHHAHLAACMADNGIESNVDCIGICLDGTGLGTDGTIWGGEFLYGGYAQFNRMISLQPMPLPGGDAATHYPARIALSYLHACALSWDTALLAPVNEFSEEQLQAMRWQLENSVNVTTTTSMGRLFDAAASLSGVAQRASFEGQAAMLFEAAADLSEEGEYPIEISNQKVLITPILEALVQDVCEDLPASKISAKFHRTVTRMIVLACQQIRGITSTSICALSGGVWQNRILLELVIPALQKQNFTVLFHKNVPANDGGLSLGQLASAACQINSK